MVCVIVSNFATMKKGQKEEGIKNFPLRLQEVALTQCREVGGLLRHLRSAAGLNPRYTKVDSDKAIGFDKFIRIELNKGMLQDEEDFMKDWINLGKLIYGFGNECGDEFNLLYKKVKKQI